MTKMTRRYLIPALVLLAVVLLLVAGTVVHYEMRQPPLGKLHQAMDSLEKARAAQAERWAGDAYSSAQRLLSSGQQVITEVSNSWWTFGSYRLADSLLTESIRMSSLALLQAANARTHQENKLESDIVRLNDSLRMWRDIIDTALPRSEVNVLYRLAAFSLQMSANMLERKQHGAARTYADSVQVILAALQRRHQQHQSSSRQRVRQSQDWVARTVEESKASGKPALVVDKSKHYLYVLSTGKVVDSMACDLGYNSGHQKRLSGDGATPEGTYRVTKVNRSSKYYRALLLNYPNADDRQRYQTNLSTGTIPANAKIGGLIEIHGHGGTGRDWTDGCVAVTNHDMDRLLNIVSINTPVTIVRVWERRR